MTTIDPPVGMSSVWGLPTPRDIRRLIVTDPRVAMTAIITAGVVLVAMFVVIGLVAMRGGDATLFAAAIGTAVGAVAARMATVLNGRRNGTSK